MHRSTKKALETEFLTSREVAARLGLSVGTVENWRYSKQGPEWVRLGKRGPKGRRGGVIRYPLTALEAWLKKQSRAA